MAAETEILRLALMAHEAAAEPALWPDFLKRYAEITVSEVTVLQVHNLVQHSSRLIHSFGISSPFASSYNEHYSRVNIWRERGANLYVAGRVNLDEEHCPRWDLERSEFYNDYLTRIKTTYTMGAVIAREGDCAPSLSALRGRAYGQSEQDVARFLLPHLSRAWTVLKCRGILSAGESVMDTLPVGIVFLDTRGSAVYWNRAADRIFRENDGLTLRGKVLATADRRSDAQLRKIVDDALSPSVSPGPPAILVERPSLRASYQLLAAPLRDGLLPRALILITDPERKQSASVELLMRLYRLTRSEAELAAKLSLGKSVEQAAQELGTSYETARTHLRRIFSKTETSRQAELLLLMARLPGAGSPGG